LTDLTDILQEYSFISVTLWHSC